MTTGANTQLSKDGNDVESALLLNGKQYPPMLPRPMRVTRAKDPRRTALALEKSMSKAAASGKKATGTKYRHKATPEEQSLAGRAGRLLGRAGAAKRRFGERVPRPGQAGDMKSPEQVVFEGRRASSKDGNGIAKKGKGKKGKGPTGRGARRAKEWRKQKTD